MWCCGVVWWKTTAKIIKNIYLSVMCAVLCFMLCWLSAVCNKKAKRSTCRTFFLPHWYTTDSLFAFSKNQNPIIFCPLFLHRTLKRKYNWYVHSTWCSGWLFWNMKKPANKRTTQTHQLTTPKNPKQLESIIGCIIGCIGILPIPLKQSFNHARCQGQVQEEIQW